MKSATVIQVPPMSGSGVMTSPARRPAGAAAAVSAVASAVAALITNMPIKASHSPPISARSRISPMPMAMNAAPRTRPAAADCAARTRSPWRRHRYARRIRPPYRDVPGRQVECREQDVHRGQPGKCGHRDPRAAPGSHRCGQPGRCQPGAQARRRARHGDPRVGPGSGRLAAELGDPAQGPRRDGGDRDAVAAGHQRVRELVGQQRGHERGRARDGRGPIRGPSAGAASWRAGSGRPGASRSGGLSPGRSSARRPGCRPPGPAAPSASSIPPPFPGLRLRRNLLPDVQPHAV
jgi:hypothetical protein